MTGETPPPSQPKQPIDKSYSITSIKACIPTPLDLDKLNYNSWSALFQWFCCTYKVHNHLETPPTTESSTIDSLHETNDSLVVIWMYSTISPKLVEMVVDIDTLAHGVWKRLKDHNMSIRSSSITDFFQDIKSNADRLANLDSPVKDMVFPSLFHNPSSSPTVLVASTTPHDKANTMATSGFDVCRNFQHGSCSYEACCKFVHGANDLRPCLSLMSSTTQGWFQPTSVNRTQQMNINVASKATVPISNHTTGQSSQQPKAQTQQFAFGPTGPLQPGPPGGIPSLVAP
ncbi:WRKY family transcription factor [Tanacetum coccineum]|uniref:WRKY family transcription factor n=1 Tax=Tanacetum coccineum TaxID=301880 RepID=A0ABQ5ED08_9ASTR